VGRAVANPDAAPFSQLLAARQVDCPRHGLSGADDDKVFGSVRDALHPDPEIARGRVELGAIAIDPVLLDP